MGLLDKVAQIAFGKSNTEKLYSRAAGIGEQAAGPGTQGVSDKKEIDKMGPSVFGAVKTSDSGKAETYCRAFAAGLGKRDITTSAQNVSGNLYACKGESIF